jgi:hypothetical protein
MESFCNHTYTRWKSGHDNEEKTQGHLSGVYTPSPTTPQIQRSQVFCNLNVFLFWWSAQQLIVLICKCNKRHICDPDRAHHAITVEEENVLYSG